MILTTTCTRCILNNPLVVMVFCHGLCCLDPCELSFSQKQTLFESRPISASVVVSAGDVDSNILEEEDDVAELQYEVSKLLEERGVFMSQILAKDDDIACLEASLSDLQAKLFEKTEELSWTKTQNQNLSLITEQLKEAKLLLSSQQEAANVFETHVRDNSGHLDADIEIPQEYQLSIEELKSLKAATLASSVAFRYPSDLGNMQFRQLESLSQARVVHIPHVWDSHGSRHMMYALKKELRPFFQQREVYWMNPATTNVETRQEPRKTAFWAENESFSYTYSGRANHAKPFTPLLKRLQQYCMPLCRAAGIETNDAFNVAFGNLYEKGHKIGFHSDDNKEIVCGTPIVSFSFGRRVCFEFANKISDAALESIILESGDVVIMGFRYYIRVFILYIYI